MSLERLDQLADGSLALLAGRDVSASSGFGDGGVEPRPLGLLRLQKPGRSL